jgi:hypothetical protein
MSDPINAAVAAERARTMAALSRQPAPSSADRRLAAFEALRDEMSEALAFKMGGPEPESDGALRVLGMDFQTMVSTLLGFRGERIESHHNLLHRGITSGDVPALFTGAGNRILRRSFESYESGLLRLCERVRSRDFRDVRAIQVDGDVALQELKEGAFTEGSLRASAESFAISTFGRTFALSRTLFTNDDLGAFSDLAERLGRHAAEFVAAKLAALLETNPALGDGVVVFHSTHANLGTTAALSETTLGELLRLMRSQKGLGGQSIAVEPRALVVPSALELAARKIITAITPGNAAPPLEVVVEPRLASATGYYLLAAPSTVAAISFTFPGSEGPTIEVGRPDDISRMGLQARIKMDFGAGWSDHRGAAKNAGA